MQQVAVRLDAATIAGLDKLAARAGLSRSDVLRELIRDYVGRA